MLLHNKRIDNKCSKVLFIKFYVKLVLYNNKIDWYCNTVYKRKVHFIGTQFGVENFRFEPAQNTIYMETPATRSVTSYNCLCLNILIINYIITFISLFLLPLIRFPSVVIRLMSQPADVESRLQLPQVAPTLIILKPWMN